MYRLAYNPTDAPVPIDAAGRTLGGREWGPVATTTDETKAAVGAGSLVYVDLPAKRTDVTPEAVAAAARVDELTKRTDGFGQLDKDALAELAVELPVAADANKPELVEALAYSDVELPATEKEKTR